MVGIPGSRSDGEESVITVTISPHHTTAHWDTMLVLLVLLSPLPDSEPTRLTARNTGESSRP